MQQVEIANQTTMRGSGPAQAIREFLRHWLTGRRGLIIAGVAVMLGGLALGWNWLTAIGAAPIILSLAPCAAMCAVGACAMREGTSSCEQPAAPEQVKSFESEAASTPIQSER